MTYDINFLLIIHIFCVDFYVDTEHLIFYFVNIYDCRLQCRKRTTVTRNNQYYVRHIGAILKGTELSLMTYVVL